MKYQQAKSLLDRLCDLAILFHASSELRTKMFEALDEHIPHLDQGCFERGCPMDDEPQPHKLSRDLRAALAQQAEPKGGGRLPPPLQAEPVQEPVACEPQYANDDGWCDWVCPKPRGYLMQCCDCELIHEVESRVAKYQPQPSEEFEVVDDPDLQLQWRMKRRDDISPQRKPLLLTDLQEALVLTNLIDRDAIDDSEEYDEGSTLAQIDELYRIIKERI